MQWSTSGESPPSSDERAVTRPLSIGDFVVELPDSLGFGVCESLDGDHATVLYTEIPDREVVRRRVDVTNVHRVALPEEMRVWLPNRFFGWWPARVMGESPTGDYLVKLAGVESPIPAPSSALRVRWDRPLARPDLAVASGMTDSQAFMDARRPVVQNLVDQRSACRGFTAVLSAAVRPYAHQLEVMARVLGDPIMRYVLADEVGLGKTIEAGLIIRQLLLDDPSAAVLVVVPRALQQQWTDELRFKLLLSDEMERGRVRVVEHDDLGMATIRQPSMLVVDEAHRIVEAALEEEAELQIAEAAASSAPGLLLLTATPIRGNARTFLGLLHLIDPSVYRLDDLEAFEDRVAMREETASAMELLEPATPTSLLRGMLSDFGARYREDEIVARSTQQLLAALDEGSIGAADLDALAAHLRETYRISRRLIRTRRSAAATAGFPVSGRMIDVRELHDPARVVVDTFAERWRSVLSEAERRSAAEMTFADGMEAVLGGPLALSAYIDRRLATEDDESFLSATELALLKQTAAQLRTTRRSARIDLLVDLVADAASRRRGKVVVFSCFEPVALATDLALAERFGPHATARHLRSDLANDQMRSIQRFLHDPSCVVLVCDESGEEGRNLQNATQLIHLDLPLSINRLEQRIGRVDRFREAAGGPAPSTVIDEPASAWVTHHLRLLAEGIGVFDRSVATLIAPLARLEADLRRELLQEGPDALAVDLPAVRAALDAESEAIDLLEEVESTSAGSDFSLGVVTEFEDFEESWGSCADAFSALFSDDGGIRLHLRSDQDRPGVFEVAVDPKLRTVPLMPVTELRQLAPRLRGARTFNRATARRVPGVRLMRIGDPLVDWVDAYVAADERGRAAAAWRVMPGRPEPELILRFDFKIEFDDAGLHEGPQRTQRRLRRRGDAHLAPVVATVWVGGDGELNPVQVEGLAKLGGSDVTLRGPRWSRVLEVFPDWETLVLDRAQRARELLLSRDHLRSRFEAAQESAAMEALRRQTVLRLRVQRAAMEGDPTHRQQILDTERQLGHAVQAGLREPKVTTVSALALVLAGEPLV